MLLFCYRGFKISINIKLISQAAKFVLGEDKFNNIIEGNQGLKKIPVCQRVKIQEATGFRSDTVSTYTFLSHLRRAMDSEMFFRHFIALVEKEIVKKPRIGILFV